VGTQSLTEQAARVSFIVLPEEIEAEKKKYEKSDLTWPEPQNMKPEKTTNSRNPLRLLLRIPVPWVFILTYILGVGLEYALPIPAAKGPLAGVRVTGAVLFGIGAVIATWGLLTFRAARTTTVPGQTSSQLVTWGHIALPATPCTSA